MRTRVMRPAARAGGIYRASRARGIMRRGMTAIEIAVTLSVMALMLGLVVPSAVRFRNGIAVRNASAEAVAAFAVARQSAIVRGTRTQLAIDNPPGHITVSIGAQPI